ncbi:LamG domain-containing protein [Candidatus Pelagibacter sp.]|nr:LamG domain-containing protein [Candidatus Pelagibacter sp.]
MAEIKLFGYTNKLSVKPGENIDFHVSADGTQSADAQLVRIIHGDEHPNGPGYMDEEIESDLNGKWDVKKQFTQLGSYLRVNDPNNLLAIDGDFTVFGYINPSTPNTGAHQWLFCRWDNKTNKGYGIGINKDGYLELVVGNGKEVDYLYSELPLVKKVWYFVGATFNYKTGEATLYQEGVVNRYNSLLGKVVPYDYRSHTKTTFRFKQVNDPQTPFIIAGAIDDHQIRGKFVSGTYAGKIDRHGVCNKVLSKEELDKICSGEIPDKNSLVAYWDTTEGHTENGISNDVIDTGPNKLNSTGFNHPVRCMTGWNWSGKNDCFRLSPKEYGGIDFHPDAITDAGWDVAKTFTLPENLKSGVYAFRLRAGNGKGLGEEYIVFFVRAKKPKAKICFLVPTASYLAYANEKLSFEAQIIQPMTGQPPTITDIDVEQYKNPEFGLSTYDSFADGAGVCFTSYKRPILNMRPKYRTSGMGITWQLPADLSIIGWLEHHYKDAYEIVTDEDLHKEGLDAIKPYNCVISGTHPEYTSEKMLDAMEDFVAEGGRFIYMGGNGFYWVVGFYDDQPWCMEVRKLDAGMRAWAAKPGEYYMQTTGERGGLWRMRGRAPQKFSGVGFIAEGFDTAEPYRKMPDAWHRTVSWITEGVEGEIFGDHGLAYGGAAGIELDRYDLSLGTPPHTKIVASSGGHSDNYVLVTEELLYAYAGLVGSLDYRIRADMTYFTAPNDGAVFCTGSIGYGQALPSNNFSNSASTVLKNVVDAFAKKGKLPGGKWTLEEKQWK